MPDKPQWQLLEWHRGCPIEHRPGIGYLSIYHNPYREDRRIGSFVHHSLEAAKAHIDKLYKHGGEAISLTKEEYAAYS